MPFLCIQSKHSEQNPDRKDHLEPEEKVWCYFISKYASTYFLKSILVPYFCVTIKVTNKKTATKIAEVHNYNIFKEIGIRYHSCE